MFSLPVLTTFFPTILSCIQLNVALDEVLSILLSTFASLRSVSPRPELSVDLIVPLVHLLPHVAGNHADPDIRHFTFRIISLILGLSPPPIRFRVLEELLSDDDLPAQMRVAAIGLLKEATMEGLNQGDINMFASPLLLSTFGPIVLRPHPPTGFGSLTLGDFMESAEPLRLVECLGFYYVLLLRDTDNRVRRVPQPDARPLTFEQTGVRDPDALKNVQNILLEPLRSRLVAWRGALAHESLLALELKPGLDSEEHDDHDIALQLDILDMWVERSQSAIDSLSH